MPKLMEPFAIVSVQSSTLAINEHGTHNTVLFYRVTLAQDSKPSTNAFQCLPVEQGPPTDFDTNWRNN